MLANRRALLGAALSMAAPYALKFAKGAIGAALSRRRAGLLDAAKNAAISLGKSALSGAINSAAGTATSMLARRAKHHKRQLRHHKRQLRHHKRRAGFLDAAKNAAISLGKSALSGAINSAAGTATSMLARRA